MIISKTKSFFDLKGIRIWNYNSNLELSYGGVKDVYICINNNTISQKPLTLRRAPGNLNYDFFQELLFTSDICLEDNKMNIHCDMSLKGFVFEMIIFSTWGDSYYVGLNGIEFFGENGKHLTVTELSMYHIIIQILN